MKKLTVLSASLLAATLSLTGCGGDDNDSINDSVANVVNPDAVTNQTIKGMISDKDGNPLDNAIVRVGDKKVTTDTDGSFSLDSSTSDDEIVVLIKKDGYLTSAKQIKVLSSGTYTLDVTLYADQVTTEFNNSAGISDLLVSGATVSIPSNAVVKADGKAYTGSVKIAANYYNPDSVEGAQAFAQPYVGQNEDGSDETGLVTVGVIDVKLTDPVTSDELDLKEGTTATLTFPAATTDQDLETIPMWYYDEDKMIWVKDGVATRQPDGSYQAQVSHFTLWNLDIALLEYSALVQGCFVEEDTQEPIAGGIDAVIKGRGFVNFGGIDNEGKFSAQVPINTPLTLAPHYNSESFAAVDIPALQQNTVYKINNGTCISAKDPSADDLFTYVDVFEQLPAEPVIVTPNPQPMPPIKPLQPNPVETKAGLIGHYFYFNEDWNAKQNVLKDVELGSLRATANNTMEYVEQSLYGKTNYQNEDYDGTYYILTPSGLEPHIEETPLTDGKLFIAQWYNTTFSNNVLAQRLNNGASYNTTLQDVSIANQKIGDILALDNGDVEDDVPLEVINRINQLPASLSVFDSNASCKKLVSISNGNQDYIEFDTDVAQYKDLATAASYYDSYKEGTWAGIPWIASYDLEEVEDNDYDAYVKYEGKVYHGDYVKAGNESLTDAEKNECALYNDAAKDQILKALQEAYPAL